MNTTDTNKRNAMQVESTAAHYQSDSANLDVANLEQWQTHILEQRLDAFVFDGQKGELAEHVFEELQLLL